ncbi:MAG TPA: galactokinase [Chitinophagaceae bacterium]|nr:galactokinase [Chitinophagaceae bacterium]
MDNIEVLKKLKEFISGGTILVRSPGRINLIGEHTDYNEGFVLPAAIDKAAYVALTPRADNKVYLYATDLKEQYVTDIDEIIRVNDSNWPNYLLGVVHQFKLAGVKLQGFNAVLTSDVPIGAGLSSSAAVECAMALALNKILNADFTKLTLAKMAQKAEHDFAGVRCGIMDQFASIFGKQNHVIRLDCRSLEYQYVPFHLKGIKIVLFDTDVKHSLAASEYNIRRTQCENGVELIKQHFPDIKSLRDVSIEMLEKYVLPVDRTIYSRCKYVVEENNRLQRACSDLSNNDILSFGKKMFETHDGLSQLYNVSCDELDFLVDSVRDESSVLGARMMGGGFGGCTINLVKENAVDALIEKVSSLYKKIMHKHLKAYIAETADGTSIIKTI